jgi:large subunit ribosomal protein L3
VAAIIGKKLGMTQVFTDDGTRVPVTVIEAEPNTVTAVRIPDRDGYAAVQVAGIPVDEGKLNKPQLGHLKKAGAPPSRALGEFRDEAPEAQIGEQLTVEQFEPGQRVKVSATAIGKGFQGTIKRHNFGRGPVSHGSHNVRAPGSIGASADPARVFKGRRMPGRMGGKRVTERGLSVFDVDAERNLLLLRGAVPGPKGGTVEVCSDG